jgi:uncharacterized membrane protein YecN with MAPEG domain
MQIPSPSTVILIVLLLLIAWRVHARFRRLIGRQRLSKIRPRITLTIYPALTLLLCVAARSQPDRLWWLGAALGAGSLLGVFGLRRTRFEPTRKGLFYTPNAHLGIALLLLFVARIAYRFIEVYFLAPDVPHGLDDFARSSLTLSAFGLLAGYNIAYAIGLWRWRFRVLEAKRQREALKETTRSPSTDRS